MSVWAVAAGPTLVDLAGKGFSGARGAILLAVIAAAVIACLRLDVLGRLATLVASAAVVALGAVLTIPVVGRAPLLVVAVGIFVAEECWVGLRTLGWGPRTAIRLTATTVHLIAGVVWLATGNAGLTLALVALAGATAMVVRAVPRIGDLEARPQAAVAVWWQHPARAAAAGARRRRLSETVDAVVRTARPVVRAVAGLPARAASGTASALRWCMARANRPIVLTGVAAAAIVAPIYPRLVPLPPVLVRGTNDIPGTIERAHWIQWWPFRMSVPHPGWSLALRVFMPILGERWAVVFILSVATGVAAAVLVTVARGRWDREEPLRWPFACAFALGWVVLESPAVLLPSNDEWWARFRFAGELARGTSYAALHQWSTPTITMSMPFVFGLFMLVLLVLRRTAEEGSDLPRLRRLLVVATVVTTLVQPATTLALVPALPIYLVVTRSVTREAIRSALCFVVPGTLLVLGQIWFLASDVSPWEQATWIWRPFWVLPYFGANRVAFWAVFAFFPIVAWAAGPRFRRDPGLRLATLGFFVSVVPFLLLEQTTVADVPDGDLGVPPLMALILAFLCALRLLLTEAQRLWDRRGDPAFRVPPWAFVAGGLLVLMLCAGMLDLAMASGWTNEN